MTAFDDDQGADHDRSLGERALDLLVYVPAGVVLTVLDDFPELATRGRARLEQELHNAEFVGRIAVQMGLRQLRHQVETLTGDRGSVGSPAPAVPARPAAPAAPAAPSGPPRPHRRVNGELVPIPKVERDPAVDQAIPDYDTLSASQVVRRLDGLSADELRAVMDHELATRGRRTIVHRAEQLLAPAAPGGPDAS